MRATVGGLTHRWVRGEGERTPTLHASPPTCQHRTNAEPGLKFIKVIDAALAPMVELLDEQISALAALEASGIYDDKMRGLGVDSSYDGQRWYNFETDGYVECGCAGAFLSRADSEEEELTPSRLSADELTSI